MKTEPIRFVRGLIVAGCSVALALGASSTARAVQFFGLNNTPLGSATLDTSDSTGRRLPVNNLGSSGQDGVSIELDTVQVPNQPFSLDVSLDPLSQHAIGSYLRTTQLSDLNSGGAPQAVSTVQATQVGANMIQLDVNLSPLWDDVSPTTIEYRSGGPNGPVVHTETVQSGGASFTSNFWPDTFYVDWNSPRFSAGADWGSAPSSLSDARGVPLDPALGISFIDVLAPSNFSGVYSAAQVTAGDGDISSFTVTGEAVAVPEPSGLAILGAGAVAWLIARRRHV